MASRQASALARTGRLRAGMITTLKRHFPDLFQRAEREVSARLSDVDDELLLAYLEGFVGTLSRRPENTPSLSALGAALVSLGIPLTGDDPAAWVETIHRLRHEGATIAVRHGDTAQPTRTPPPTASLNVSSTEADTGVIEDLFDDLPAAPTVPATTTAMTATLAEADADAFSDSAFPSTDVHIPTIDELFVDPAVDDADRDEFLSGDDDIFADGDDIADLFDDPAPARWPGALGEVTPTESWSPSPVRASTSLTPTQSAPPAVAPEEPIVPAPPSEVTPVTGTPSEPLRPQLFPPAAKTPSRGRKARSVRTQATPAEDLLFDVPPEDGPATGTVDDRAVDALLAATNIPRPVFIRDLVAVGGSRENVEAWEQICRADPGRYPVRFIAPKSRHRMRGSLVIPEERLRTESKESVWARCVNLYRGAAVYEMGVLLHRIIDEVVAARFEDNLAILRLNSSRGLVGIVVSFDADLDPAGAATRDLSKELVELFGERLTLLAVLTTAASDRTFERLISQVAAAAASVRWQPTYPVVASRSWEYADDRGSSAHLVLGA